MSTQAREHVSTTLVASASSRREAPRESRLARGVVIDDTRSLPGVCWTVMPRSPRLLSALGCGLGKSKGERGSGRAGVPPAGLPLSRVLCPSPPRWEADGVVAGAGLLAAVLPSRPCLHVRPTSINHGTQHEGTQTGRWSGWQWDRARGPATHPHGPADLHVRRATHPCGPYGSTRTMRHTPTHVCVRAMRLQHVRRATHPHGPYAHTRTMRHTPMRALRIYTYDAPDPHTCMCAGPTATARTMRHTPTRALRIHAYDAPHTHTGH